MQESPPSTIADSRLWREALACFRPYRGTALLTGAVILTTGALNLAPPLLVRGLIDDAIPAGRQTGSATPLIPYILGLVFVPLAASLIGLGQQYLSTQIGQGILSDLRNRLFRSLQSQSLRFFTTTRAGEITSRTLESVTACASTTT